MQIWKKAFSHKLRVLECLQNLVVIVFDYALKEIKKRRGRYALNIMVITLVVVLLITLNSLSLAYKDASGLPFKSIHSTIIIQKNGNVPENTTGVILSCSLAPIRVDYLSKVRTIDGVKNVSSGLLLWVFDHDNFKRVFGVNWNDSLGTGIRSQITVSSSPQTNTEALVDKAYANQYGLGINQYMNISGTKFLVSGIVETSGKNVVSSDVYVNLASAQTLAYNSQNLQEAERFEDTDINIIFVDVEQINVKEVAQRLNEIFNVGPLTNGNTPTGQVIGTYNIYTSTSFENEISSVFKLSDKLTLTLSLVVLVGAILIIVKSISHIILERRKEFGIMKAIGFRNKDIQKEVGAETFLQICIGYVIGVTLSFIAIVFLATTRISINVPWELNPYPHFLVSTPDLAGTTLTYFLPIKFQVTYALLSGLVVLAIGILTAMIIMRRINQLKAMEVLRYE